MVVQQNEASGAFISLAIFLNFSVVRLSVEAILEVSVESITLDDEASDVFLRELVIVVTNRIRTILRTDMVALHLCITTGAPFAVLDRRFNKTAVWTRWGAIGGTCLSLSSARCTQQDLLLSIE